MEAAVAVTVFPSPSFSKPPSIPRLPAVTPFPTAIAAVSDVIAIRRESVRGVLALIIVGLLVVYSLGMLLYVYQKEQ